MMALRTGAPPLLLRSAALLALLGAVRAQCTLDALPDNTQFVDPAGCSVGADGIPDGETCTIQCNAGYAQGAGGDYDYVCEGTDLTDAEPDCNECPVDEFNDTPGAAECTTCPANSGTAGTGSTAEIDCLCNPGFLGDPIADECEACALGTYKAVLGPGPCDTCPANTNTAETGSIAETDCLCNPGFLGDPIADECEACALGTYKAVLGPGPCDTCPANTNTAETGSIAETDCLCNPGFLGDPIADECEACALGTYKAVLGPGPCTDCPDNSNTAETGSVAETDCLCVAGFAGDPIADECDECPENTYKAGLGPGPCTTCPDNSGTDGEPGQTDVSACLCNPGFAGETAACVGCVVDTYEPEYGVGPCTMCPENSGTEGQEGAQPPPRRPLPQRAVALCGGCMLRRWHGPVPAVYVCGRGGGGSAWRLSLSGPAWEKPLPGLCACQHPAPAISLTIAGTLCCFHTPPLPPHAPRHPTESTEPSDCICDDGFAGTIGGPLDVCRVETSVRVCQR
eukprot:COSAG01_NODE_1546_length_9957_cov_20.812741_9_plen_513_part_00